ncbi:tetratricopeptide repeat protein [Sphingomonas aracearum]|uniref:TolA-binding protein n=1 Tax=Sphingomonas aracearum TaxID=2283317 RepID=A0A369VXU1_9SPHN|nr:hypothetical protein [Sphingomonas aracearum]RDE04651.1 hypothetical protein DVW87_13740 [Sphingomonas aracearum]
MRNLVLATALSAGLFSAAPVAAQASLEPRVDRLESEMRAVQRKVFPGGAGQYVQPQITPGRDQADPIGTPATSPVADLTARVDALEGQLRDLTGQVEQANNRVRTVSDAFATYRRETDARIAALEGTRTTTPAPATGAPEADAGPAPARPATTPAAAAGITRRPPTGDAGEDAYLYGYDLWAAKSYPEAEKQLQAAFTKYPKHKRASYARNLYGRALMDDGQLNSAARAFLDNYRTLPDGERAPDSLYYLAQTLTRLKKPKADICKVYGELGDVYGATLRPELAAQVAAGRRQASCA